MVAEYCRVFANGNTIAKNYMKFLDSWSLISIQ